MGEKTRKQDAASEKADAVRRARARKPLARKVREKMMTKRYGKAWRNGKPETPEDAAKAPAETPEESAEKPAETPEGGGLFGEEPELRGQGGRSAKKKRA